MALDILPAGPRDEILALLNSTNALSSASSVETIYTDFVLNAAQAIEEEQEEVMDLLVCCSSLYFLALPGVARASCGTLLGFYVG